MRLQSNAIQIKTTILISLFLLIGIIIPQYSEAQGQNVTDNFEFTLPYILDEGQISPNKKWLNVFNGFGEIGIKKDPLYGNYHYISPKVAYFAL